MSDKDTLVAVAALVAACLITTLLTTCHVKDACLRYTKDAAACERIRL